jgi:hypothetical protein
MDAWRGSAKLTRELARRLDVQQVAGWPVAGEADLATKFFAAEASPEERSRLERSRAAVTEVGKDVIAEVLAKLATQGVQAAHRGTSLARCAKPGSSSYCDRSFAAR